MFRFVIVVIIVLILGSCATQYQPIESTPMISHSEVMTQDFPTKIAVFVKFGAPTSKETVGNIENWYFKLSEVTNSNAVGFSTGYGLIAQNTSNPYIPEINRSLVTIESKSTIQRTNSTTVETYLKFWFINDTVVKWETFGVDYSRPKTVSPVDEYFMTQLKI
jgi:hypothetical protein